MSETATKEEVEALLRYEITDKEFQEALQYAKHMQEYIYEQEHRPVVLQNWYLVKLTEEYVRILNFSKYTKNLCKTLRNVEIKPGRKDHVSDSAL